MPPNGLIFVQQTKKGCAWSYNSESADTSAEEAGAKGCGNVYVSGYYN